MLTNLSNLSSSECSLAEEFIEWGLLASLEDEGERKVSTAQFQRLMRVRAQREYEGVQAEALQLFASEHELGFLGGSGVFRTAYAERSVVGSEVILQLLPYILEASLSGERDGSLGSVDIPGTGTRILSKNATVLSKLADLQTRLHDASDNKVAFFSRSASYMGSKSAFGGILNEIIALAHKPGGSIFDLMCGSGAASSAFCQRWKVYSSDAQEFSKYLAVVQGGGFCRDAAEILVSDITKRAASAYAELPPDIHENIDKEEFFLTTELSKQDKNDFLSWAREYPRVGTEQFSLNDALTSEIDKKRQERTATYGTLFVRYYANLFFGVRQAAEIDCLRTAINEIKDTNAQAWAMGALICAVSACADNYGGHFAQPKFDVTQSERILSGLKDSLMKRSLSVTHEFSIRLLNLAAESEKTENSVHILPGPWRAAVEHMSAIAGSEDLLVYLDPPYTREEYSRYYHVLETLVRYDYPAVSGKSASPLKGSQGRFSSEFFTRNAETVELLIAEIIIACLTRGWPCVWSYSTGGIAKISKVIEACTSHASGVDLFEMKYAYKAQGKQLQKQVKEYVIVFRKN